jgi:hypothetical protein
MRTGHSIFTEATDAGFLGATAVAVWFLVHDLLRGRPLLTPSVLGQLFILGETHPATHAPVFAAVILYTALHFILFVVFAALVALLVRLAVDQPVVRFALVVLFVAFELCFYVVINVVSAEVSGLFPLWTVAGANLLAAVVMGAYFWRRYPELRRVLQEEPLGA